LFALRFRIQPDGFNSPPQFGDLPDNIAVISGKKGTFCEKKLFFRKKQKRGISGKAKVFPKVSSDLRRFWISTHSFHSSLPVRSSPGGFWFSPLDRRTDGRPDRFSYPQKSFFYLFFHRSFSSLTTIVEESLTP